MELGKRLTKVADLIQTADTLADVGCDHGYLSVYLIENKRCRRVIAMDINKGPLQKARENIERFGYGDYIETRLSDGIAKLEKDEAEGFVCAGMGGPLALQILWNDRDKIQNMKQIVLQPQSELWLVRRTLKEWGFIIEKEDIELEDGKYYFMMRICPGDKFDMIKPPKADAVLFEDAKDVQNADVSVISEEEKKRYAYELYAKELLDAEDELLREYICKEIKRLTDVYDALCLQEDSVKCRARKEAIKRELIIHQWALGRYV